MRRAPENELPQAQVTDEMNDAPENLSGIDERVEVLICRSLDGEATVQEQAELDAILARSVSARTIFDEYRRHDIAAATALKLDFDIAKTVVVARPRRGLWLATAGVALGAAAVFAMSFLSSLLTGGGASQPIQVTGNQTRRVAPTIQEPTYVDYNGADDLGPLQRERTLHRDLIGIPGSDRNTIYILERNVRSTRVAPISGDF